MLNKAIQAKSKVALQLFISIRKIDAYCWKSYRPNKKEENSKFYKEEKTKPADSQLIILTGITI